MAAYISGIPVYEALVEGEDTGMVRISLVDDPAVLVGWQAFRATPPSAQMYSVADEERRIVRGVVMRADFPIYRRDAHGEYFVIYHADTIREMAEKYLAESRQNNVDTMHDGAEVAGVQMVQWFIKDTAAGINPAGFDADIADGSLFAEFHITDDAIWEAVKAGTYKGFSLEGVFAMAPEQRQQTIDEIVDELAGQFSITDMSKIERLKEILRAELARQEKDVRPEKFGAVTTDRGPLEWDGEDDLKAGDPVYAVAEDGTRTAAEDGDYKTEDGKTIVVAGGVVAEIRDPEAEVAPEAEAPETEAEAEEPAAAEPEAEAPAAEPEAEEPDYKALYEDALKRIEELEKALADAQAEAAAETEALRSELEAARQQPMAKPAHEEVKAAEAVRKTGNKGLDRIAELMSR